MLYWNLKEKKSQKITVDWIQPFKFWQKFIKAWEASAQNTQEEHTSFKYFNCSGSTTDSSGEDEGQCTIWHLWKHNPNPSSRAFQKEL